MNPLDYFISYYGTRSYTDIVLSWGGTGTTWNLYEVNNPTPIYTGTDFTYSVELAPNTRGDYRLETTVSGTTYSQTIMTYTTALPTPTALTASAVTSSTYTLTWEPPTGITAFQIGDVSQSYSVVSYVSPGNTTSFEGAQPSTRHSYAVRSLYTMVMPDSSEETFMSKWSNPTTLFTLPSTVVTPGTYDIRPNSIYTWAAGKAGSTDPQWLSSTSDWYAGEGSSWGDNRGTMSTYFFYGSPNPFIAYTGGTCTRIQVYLDRNGPTGDPGLVLSQWGLHNYAEKPTAAPSYGSAYTDVGQYARGAYGWIDLPVAWGQTLIDGTYARGIFWGATPERYQSSLYADITTTPRTGDLKITVT